MIGENRQLVTNEPVEVEDYRKLPIILEESIAYTPFFNEGIPEEVNM